MGTRYQVQPGKLGYKRLSLACGARSSLVRSCRRDDLSIVTFYPPDFTKPLLTAAPDARFVPAPADAVLPDGFFSSPNLPTYVKVGGEWKMPREPRMDSVILLDADGVLWTREMRR